MDIEAKVKEIESRCQNDENFRQLLEDDFGTAVESCGIASVDAFTDELDASGLLSDEDMNYVSGGGGWGGTGNYTYQGPPAYSYFGNAYYNWRSGTITAGTPRDD